MIIDIYSDASFALQTRDAGFAHWIVCCQFETQKSAYIPHIKDMHEAELHAINDAVLTLLSREVIPVIRINVYTDSAHAIGKLRKERPKAFYTLLEFTVKNGFSGTNILTRPIKIAKFSNRLFRANTQ